MSHRQVKIWYWIVDHLLPKKLMYFTTMRILADASTSKYSSVEVGKISAMDCIELFASKYNIQ